MEACLAVDPSALSAHLVAALCAGKIGRPDADQIRHLEAVIASEGAMPDHLQVKYLPPGIIHLSLEGRIADQITAAMPFDSVGASLLLAELLECA